MNTLQAYRFALDPNNTQIADLRRHAGAARFVFNWGLARVKAALSQREAEQTYGLTGDMLTPMPWTLPALRLEWNKAKSRVVPWWAECSKEAFSAGLDRLAWGLKNFTDSRKGKRKGRRVGFPRPVAATAHSRAGRCRPRGEASRCALHRRDGAEPEASGRFAAPAAHRIAGLRPVETR